MNLKALMDSLQRGLRRPDVRQHPFRAISRRLGWRRHWKNSSSPILISPWWRELQIILPHTGNAALIYYRTLSYPSLVALLQTLLFPGMTFVDVGAHIGEYTLIGAHMVGATGKVCAIEPIPACVEGLRRNVSINKLDQVSVHTGALSASSGKIGFLSDSGNSGWIAATPAQVVFETPTWALDDFLPHAKLERADVIKLDAGGNELDVLRGGSKTLQHSTMVMKLYHPSVTQARFGYPCHDSIKLLLEMGLKLKIMVRGEVFPIHRPEDIDAHFDRLDYCHVILAKRV